MAGSALTMEYESAPCRQGIARQGRRYLAAGSANDRRCRQGPYPGPGGLAAGSRIAQLAILVARASDELSRQSYGADAELIGGLSPAAFGWSDD